MNLVTLREARLRALTLGELPWSDDFVRLAEAVEEAVHAAEADSVADLKETLESLRANVQSKDEAMRDAEQSWDAEREAHAVTKQELARLAYRCAAAEAKLPVDVQGLRAQLAELTAREAFARKELGTAMRSRHAVVAAVKLAVGLLTPKARIKFCEAPESAAYTDALVMPGRP